MFHNRGCGYCGHRVLVSNTENRQPTYIERQLVDELFERTHPASCVQRNAPKART